MGVSIRPSVLFLSLVLLLLAACEPRRAAPEVESSPVPWEEARARGVDFRGLGQEPGWVLEIREGAELRLLADYGQRQVSVPHPERVQEGAGRVRYHGRGDHGELRVLIEATTCHDVMSGEEFPARVTVLLDGTEYEGCGRWLDRRR